MPTRPDGRCLRHEDYSALLVSEEMTDVIDDHPVNRSQHNLRGRDIADFIRGRTLSAERLFWRELLSGQLDADRMDYLLRDAWHCGVSYGSFDLGRIVDTVTVVDDPRPDAPTGLRVAVSSGGRHAAEGLLLARYFMFQQVYFHHVRKAYDHHAEECLRGALRSAGLGDRLPAGETPESRRRFIELDDWVVFDYCRSNRMNVDSRALLEHKHDRLIYETGEVASPGDIARVDSLCDELMRGGIKAWKDDAAKDWYSTRDREIRIADDRPRGSSSALQASTSRPLSIVSSVVAKLQPSSQRRIFVPDADRKLAQELIERTGA